MHQHPGLFKPPYSEDQAKMPMSLSTKVGTGQPSFYMLLYSDCFILVMILGPSSQSLCIITCDTKRCYAISISIMNCRCTYQISHFSMPVWWLDIIQQGKSFIKDALKCMAHGLRHKFSCVSRKCVSMKDMVFQLQRECYIKHNLCLATKENVNVIVEMIHFHDLFFKGYVQNRNPLIYLFINQRCSHSKVSHINL